MPRFEHRCFGLGSSVAIGTDAGEPAEVVDEVSWGGLAGTMWWINPRIGIAAVLMTQRYFGFGNPYSRTRMNSSGRPIAHWDSDVD